MTYTLGQITDPDYRIIGRKAVILDQLIKEGWRVPSGIILSTSVYNQFIRETGLFEWLILTLDSRAVDSMRWEEVWDMSNIIRHKFIKTPFPDALQKLLLSRLDVFDKSPVVVRSSSPLENSENNSFAGLHDSILDVQGRASILQAVKEVWSSLWSDRALVYSRELSLFPEKSSMAVIIQVLIRGQKSGVLFTRSPDDEESIIIETVDGLRESFIKGSAEPERYSLSRSTGKLSGQHSASEKSITDNNVSPESLFMTALDLESKFNSPQNIEWTILNNEIYILRTRPISTASKDSTPLWERQDKRAWYRSLRKDSEELEILKNRIEKEFMPQIEILAYELSGISLENLDDSTLEIETGRRKIFLAQWENTYRDICIPFTHGVRIFGEVYNRLLQPDSPFEFINLLVNQNLKSLERNIRLQDLSRLLDSEQEKEDSAVFQIQFESFLQDYGQSSFFDGLLFDDRKKFIIFLKELIKNQNTVPEKQRSQQELEKDFLDSFKALGRDDGPMLLDMAKISYKLRDDNNIQIGKIRGEYFRAKNELEKRHPKKSKPEEMKTAGKVIDGFSISKRQVTGTIASSGYAAGPARVLSGREDLFKTRKGEIIICDSIDPNITFVIPLAAGIIERRGGMLVHGAIIAREYSIPCITGVENVIEIINNGDLITVDAYNGIVVIEKAPVIDRDQTRSETEINQHAR